MENNIFVNTDHDIRGIVSVKGLSQFSQWTRSLSCEIVDKGFRKLRIIVFVEKVSDGKIHVETKKKHLIVYGFSGDKTYYCDIPLGFKPRQVKYKIKNGVMTIDVIGKRLLFF